MPHEIIGNRELHPTLEQSSRCAPLDQPWALTPQEFTRRAPLAAPKLFTAARDETAALTDQITKVERELDGDVTALYGL